MQAYHPEILNKEVRAQIEAVLESPALIQYMIEHTIHSIIQNVDINTKGASGDYMRGLNEGALDLLNSILSGSFVSSNIPLTEDNTNGTV